MNISKNIVKYKKLISGKHHRRKGRCKQGFMTVRHRGGGHKQLYRQIDFQRKENNIPGKIISVEYDPNRNAFISLVHYQNGKKTYILSPRGISIGDTILSGPKAPIILGNALPLSAV